MVATNNGPAAAAAAAAAGAAAGTRSKAAGRVPPLNFSTLANAKATKATKAIGGSSSSSSSSSSSTYKADIMQELHVLSFMHRTCTDTRDPRGQLIVQYAHIFESPTDVTVVMEYFNGGDLFQWVRSRSRRRRCRRRGRCHRRRHSRRCYCFVCLFSRPGWMEEEWMDGWMDGGGMDGWMDGWVGASVITCSCFCSGGILGGGGLESAKDNKKQ